MKKIELCTMPAEDVKKLAPLFLELLNIKNKMDKYSLDSIEYDKHENAFNFLWFYDIAKILNPYANYYYLIANYNQDINSSLSIMYKDIKAVREEVKRIEPSINSKSLNFIEDSIVEYCEQTQNI